MDVVVAHLPHLLPALVALGLLLRYSREVVTGEEPASRAARQRAAAGRERGAVARAPARAGVIALAPLLFAAASGAWLYGLALAGRPPSAALVWSHAAVSSAALGLVARKLVLLGACRLRRALDPRRALREGVSLVLGALGLPLLVSGAALLAAPSTASMAAYAHLVCSAWWIALLGVHLARYLRSALAATFASPSAARPAPDVTHSL